MNRQLAQQLSRVEIATQDFAECGEACRRLGSSIEQLGVELLLLFKDNPTDEDGLFLPELLAASSACDAAMVELQMITEQACG